METGSIVGTGSPDDQTAKVGEITLRAELMDEWYWWCCYLPELYADKYGEADTMELAKAAAIAAMNEHLKEK